MVYFTLMEIQNEFEHLNMTVMEKVAWTEMVVSSVATLVVLFLLPIYGHGASSGFALLGGVVLSFWFLRHRHKQTIVDERDLEIERLATQRGAEAAWWLILFSVIAMLLIPGNPGHAGYVSKVWLNWIVWIQFAVFFGAKGVVSINQYRKQAGVA